MIMFFKRLVVDATIKKEAYLMASAIEKIDDKGAQKRLIKLQKLCKRKEELIKTYSHKKQKERS